MGLVGLIGWLACVARISYGEKLLAGSRSAYWAYRSSWERRSQVGGAFGEHRWWQMRLHCSHSTALFLTFWRHTLQMTASPDVNKQSSLADLHR